MGSFGQTVAAPAAPLSAKTPSDAALGWRHLVLVWAAGMVCAILLIANKPDATPDYGLVFNEMLVRLLHGRFDISPATIGDEAIVYHGHTYAYFGLFCALLRLPLVLIGQTGLDIAKPSMILAAAVSLAARLGALNLALNRAEGVSRTLRLILLGAVAVGGESLQYLRPSMFQEVCSWGAALASVFVLLAVIRIFGAGRRPGWLYAGMAGIAGLELLCRVSFGMALYAALGLMLCVEAWRGRARLTTLRTLAPAALILTLFAGTAAAINEARWNDPLMFVPMSYQTIQIAHAPDRAPRLERYGALNLQRVPFALQYYFAPIWVAQDRKGALIFQNTQLQLFDYVELPPSSLLLSDQVVAMLAAIGLWALARRRGRTLDPLLATSALVGLTASGAVMLLAISLCFRYRMDFYPALDFAACLGAAALRLDPSRQPVRRFLYPAAGGLAVALAGLVLYCGAPFASATDLDLSHGWIGPFNDLAKGMNPYMGHQLPGGRWVNVPLSRR